MIPMPRLIAVLLCAWAVSLGQMPGQALAAGPDRDVARMVSFGGVCLNCNMAGRKLTGAQFVGANFAGAVFIGTDLRGATLQGSNFAGANFMRADLRGAEFIEIGRAHV